MNAVTPRFSVALLAALILSIQFSPVASARSGTPPTNQTGAPGAPGAQRCATCHGGEGNGSVDIDFSGLTSYQPGETYTFKVKVAQPSRRRFGFSVVARDPNNSDVGTWTATGDHTQVHGPGGNHASHQNAPLIANETTYEVSWKAPDNAVGDIKFYLGAVAANGNNRQTGDSSYHTSLTITEEVVAQNQPPEIALQGNELTATSGLPATLPAISVSDPDAEDGELTAELSVEEGTLQVKEGVADGVTDITDNGSSTVILKGSAAQLTATLSAADGVQYTSAGGFAGSDTFTIKVNDNGNTGPGGEQTTTETLPVTVGPAPTIGSFKSLAGGAFEFVLQGAVGRTYIIEASTGLEQWGEIQRVTLANGAETITDNEAGEFDARYYRVREAP